MPAKLACLACRAAKLRCDASQEGRCSRCVALGTECIRAGPPAALAGRPKRPRASRAAASLSSSALHEGADRGGASAHAPVHALPAAPALAAPPSAAATPAARWAQDALVGRTPNETISLLTCHLSSAACKAAWLQQALFVSSRQKSLRASPPPCGPLRARARSSRARAP